MVTEGEMMFQKKNGGEINQMKTKELINKTFDKVIEKLKGDEMIEIKSSGKEVGMSGGIRLMNQVLDDKSIEKTDKNITKICKEVLK